MLVLPGIPILGNKIILWNIVEKIIFSENEKLDWYLHMTFLLLILHHILLEINLTSHFQVCQLFTEGDNYHIQ
jgi:hypothetical protein